MSLADRLLAAERRLCRELEAQRFGAPVTHVYNPLVHARVPHRRYVRRFANAPKRVVYLGMNPGPWGMVQTGVPFGEVALVRGWLGIEGSVARPENEHPKRPVLGFACERSEVSGARLWGAIAEHWEKPERFFRTSFVANYCPLVFMEESGRNRTPDKLAPDERGALFEACDRLLLRTIELLEPELVVGVGRFAADRARAVLPSGHSTRVGEVLHPSPASPIANRGWAPQARKQLQRLGVCG
jgi:single-strand selective monofunctional uracil DNA glycosylase